MSDKVLCKVCKAVVKIEEESANPSGDDDLSSEEELGEEAKDTVPGDLSKEKDKASFANAKRFLSATSQNFLKSSTMRKDNNPQVVSMLKEKLIELGKMTERVSKVEKLLCETLENLDVQKKQYEQKIENLNQTISNKQIYLESFMKNGQMDKVVIRNRETRIAELVGKVAELEETASTGSSTKDPSETPGADSIVDSTEIASLSGQLAAAKNEIDEWKA